VEDKEVKNDSPSAIFKSVVKKGDAIAPKRDVVPPVGAYQIDLHTISKAVKVDEEDDPELAIKKPPFLSSQPRFSELNKKKEAEEDIEPEANSIIKDKNISDLFKKKPKQVAAFNSRSKRFDYKAKGDVIGPG